MITMFVSLKTVAVPVLPPMVESEGDCACIPIAPRRSEHRDRGKLKLYLLIGIGISCDGVDDI